MAAVRFPCPLCEQNIKAPASQAGQSFICPRCGGTITSPSSNGALTPSEPVDAPAVSGSGTPSIDDDFDSLFWDKPAASSSTVDSGTAPSSAPPPQAKSPQPSKPPTPPPTSPPTSHSGPTPPPPPCAPSPPSARSSPPAAPELPKPRTTLPTAPGRVEKEAERTSQEATPESPKKKKRRKKKVYKFRISCQLCQTRIGVSVRQVGDEVRCPDCHSMVLVNAPPGMLEDKPKAKPKVEDDDILGLAPAEKITAYNVPDSVLERATGESSQPPDSDSVPYDSHLSLRDDSAGGTTDRPADDHRQQDRGRQVEPPPKPTRPASSIASFGFTCSLCGTRLYAVSGGDLVPCPDCLTDNIAPEAPNEPKRQVASETETTANSSENDELTLEDAVERPAYEPIANRGVHTLEQINAAGADEDSAPSASSAGSAPSKPSSETAHKSQTVDDAFNYACPKCGDTIAVTTRQVGVTYECPKCKTVSAIKRPD